MARPDPTKYFGVKPDPATKSCDWCESKAHVAYEIFKTKKSEKLGVGTAQYLYACANAKHEALARENSRAPEAEK